MKKIGIVGGVGPEASNKFCELLIKRKRKLKDQDNIPFIHYCNPQIPDRTEFILGEGEDPIPELIRSCLELEKINADFIVIPCNTAHCFLDKIQENVSIPIVDMTKVLIKKIITERPLIKRVGVLATTGSIKSRLFEDYLNSLGIETVAPDEIEQEALVMEAIYGKKGIKTGKKAHPKRLLLQAAENLIQQGAEAIILGCTEIPLVLKQKDFAIKLYDPMDILAKEIVQYVESEEKTEVITVKYVITNPSKQ